MYKLRIRNQNKHKHLKKLDLKKTLMLTPLYIWNIPIQCKNILRLVLGEVSVIIFSLKSILNFGQLKLEVFQMCSLTISTLFLPPRNEPRTHEFRLFGKWAQLPTLVSSVVILGNFLARSLQSDHKHLVCWLYYGSYHLYISN